MVSKTAMQALRHDIKESQILSRASKIIVLAFIDNHIEEETAQIYKAFTDGFYSGCDQPMMESMPIKNYEKNYNNAK